MIFSSVIEKFHKINFQNISFYRGYEADQNADSYSALKVILIAITIPR